MTMYVLIENKPEGQYTASIIGLPTMQAQGPSENEALMRLRALFTNQFHTAKIVPLDIDQQEQVNPWLIFSDQLKNNPLLPEITESINTYRYQIDAVPEES